MGKRGGDNVVEDCQVGERAALWLRGCTRDSLRSAPEGVVGTICGLWGSLAVQKASHQRGLPLRAGALEHTEMLLH